MEGYVLVAVRWRNRLAVTKRAEEMPCHDQARSANHNLIRWKEVGPPSNATLRGETRHAIQVAEASRSIHANLTVWRSSRCLPEAGGIVQTGLAK